MDVVKAKKYAVILFPEEENAVDIISSVWVLPSMTSDPIKVEKPCRYPPPKVRGAKLAKLVKGHIPPSSDWLVLSCRILEEYGNNLVQICNIIIVSNNDYSNFTVLISYIFHFR